jgi:hypothetical protein
MTVFDVVVNDRKVCRAGVGAVGVLSATVSWARLTGGAAAFNLGIQAGTRPYSYELRLKPETLRAMARSMRVSA